MSFRIYIKRLKAITKFKIEVGLEAEIRFAIVAKVEIKVLKIKAKT